MMKTYELLNLIFLIIMNLREISLDRTHLYQAKT
jgi:hypothetical protein